MTVDAATLDAPDSPDLVDGHTWLDSALAVGWDGQDPMPRTTWSEAWAHWNRHRPNLNKPADREYIPPTERALTQGRITAAAHAIHDGRDNAAVHHLQAALRLIDPTTAPAQRRLELERLEATLSGLPAGAALRELLTAGAT